MVLYLMRTYLFGTVSIKGSLTLVLSMLTVPLVLCVFDSESHIVFMLFPSVMYLLISQVKTGLRLFVKMYLLARLKMPWIDYDEYLVTNLTYLTSSLYL